MGTRHLTAVIYKDEVRVAQYGQWDGYPDGQGARVFDFAAEGKIDKLKAKLENGAVRFQTEADIEEREAWMANKGFGEWVNLEQAKVIDEEYPLDSRDIGAKILNEIIEREEPVVLTDSRDFANDGLFCEFAWLLDLDKETLNMYVGFQKEPIQGENKLATAKEPEGDYLPVQPLVSFDLNALPSKEDFLKTCNEAQEKLQ